MPKKLDSWIKNSNTHASILDLQCHGIQYGEKTVLAPFHLQLVEGQHIAILGSSGAGKTTLLRVIFDFLSTSSVKTALIPQTTGLVENISVYHNVYMGRLDQFSTISNLLNLFIPKTSAKNTIQSILDTLSVGDKIFSPCGALSGGQQQRVAIARAIYRHASILIADEPVANLDQNQAEIALQTMIDAHANCVLALHNTEQALRYCDRIIGINSGKLVLDKPADQVTAQDLADVYKTPDVQSINP